MNGSKKEELILKQALATPPSDRSAFLDKACGKDENLRKDIETKIAKYLKETKSRSSGGRGIAENRAKSTPIPSRLKQALRLNYELQERLGGGGMCDLYLATHKSLGGKWAVKVLGERLSGDPKVVKRFITEAKIEANLQHPNIVKVFNIGETGGYHYFVMEYIEGDDLTRRIASGPIAEADAVPIIIQICNALECAHDHNIIHRDLKPSNVRIDKYGSVYVLDFGIARARNLATDSTSQIETLGTPLYMSPEQFQGAHADARSDLYSLGVLIYEMLTGRNPFEGDSPHEVYTKHTTYTPEPLSKVNPRVSKSLSNIVLRLLEKEPDRRFQSVAEVTARLKSLGMSSAQVPEAPSGNVQNAGEAAESAAITAVRESALQPQADAPKRPRLESTNSRQIQESLRSPMPATDRQASEGQKGKGSAKLKPDGSQPKEAVWVLLARYIRDYAAAHQSWVVAGALLLVLVVAIVYVALQSSPGFDAAAEIDSVPSAEIIITDLKGKVVNKGVTPAVLLLKAGRYTVDLECEGAKRSVPLQIERNKTARIRENFWKEQLNSKIDALLDEYLGKAQPSNQPK